MTGSKQRNNWPTSCGSYATAVQLKSVTTGQRFAAFWRATAALLCLGLMLAPAGAAATFEMPPLPTIKKRPERLHSPRGKELFTSVSMVVIPPPRQMVLTWEYRLPIPRPTVEFVIERRPDFNSMWQAVGVSDAPPYPIVTTNAPKMFYRVGARKPL